jgi:hypothetical protein
LGNKAEKNEMGWACSKWGGRRSAYRLLVEKPEGKRPLGRPSHRWDGNIKMDFQEVGWGALTGLIWLRIMTSWQAHVNVVMNLWVP